jgi:hypothetical protein
VAVSALDDKIDDLYKAPLAEFTAARNALAKSLKGDEAKRVKALAKPNLVPWAVNQVYWRAHGVYDRLLKAGERLRKAQIAALEGKSADVRAANDAHRRAIADAVAEAERIAAAAGSKPSPDALTRSFEALSLAAEPPEPHGRMTEALQPSGFEALTGVKIAPADKHRTEPARHDHRTPTGGRHEAAKTTDRRDERHAKASGIDPKRAREEAEAARQAEEARRRHDAELRKADAAVARAEAHEKLARETWERAHDALLEARKARDEVRRSRVDR